MKLKVPKKRFGQFKAGISHGKAALLPQLPYQNEIWMKSILNLGIGKDARALVDDIQWLEATGHTRGTTWARNKKELRKSKHTMGYQIRGSASKSLF